MDYLNDVVDYTECKNCGHKTAEVIEGEDGYYATCPSCGRTTNEQFDTIEEAVASFKNDDEIEYQ